jgi:hypothetical protein
MKRCQRVNQSASEVKIIRGVWPGRGDKNWHVIQEQSAAFADAKA